MPKIYVFLIFCSIFILNCANDKPAEIIAPYLFEGKEIDNDFSLFFDFNNNNYSGWTASTNTSISVSSGALMVSGPEDGKQHYAYYSVSFDKPFSIKADVAFISGSQSSPYGMGFLSDNNVVFCFLSNNGSYKLSKYDDSWSSLINWTQYSSSFSTDWQTIELKYESNKLYFYINNSFVNSVNYYDNSQYEQIILYTQEGCTVSFDNVELNQLDD